MHWVLFAPPLFLADGSFALDAEQESERWNEHFASLLCGNLVDILVHEVEEAMAAIGSLKDEVQRVVTSLPNNKAQGKDMIPAELWKAGCEVTSNELTLILDWILRTGDVPAAWRGGRLARLCKGKGPTESTDSYRGLLKGDHTVRKLKRRKEMK